MNAKSYKAPFILIAILALTLIGFAPADTLAAMAAPPAPSSVQPTVDPPDVGRISEVLQNTLVLGKDDVDWSYAEPNLVVEQGDMLQSDETGRAEIQFQDNITFRMGEKTRIAVLEVGDRKVIGMDAGRGYLRIGSETSGKSEFLLTFPTGQIVARAPVLARIDVAADGSAEIKVLRGTLEVASTSEGARTISAQQRLAIGPDGRMNAAAYNLAKADDFDQWNEERDMALSTYRRPEYIQQNIVGEQDLNGYGRWVYMDQYNSYAWQPTVVETWRPYYYGHWSYSRYYGWTWIPEEPWGYVTYHYGSWNYDPYYGWVWVPGYVWRPAHVYWVDYDNYIGWVPLDYYGYPVITTYPYHVTTVSTGFIDFFSFTFVFTDYFHYHDHHYYYHHDGDYHDHHGDYDHDHGDHHGDYDGHGDNHGDHGDHYGDDHGHRDDQDHIRNNYDKLDQDYQRTTEHGEFKQIPGKYGDSDRIASSVSSAQGPKVKFLKTPDNQGLRKSLQKGMPLQTKTDYAEFLNTTGNTEIARKVAAINKYQSAKTVAPAALPQKMDVKKLDFRNKVSQRQFTTIRNSNGNLKPANSAPAASAGQSIRQTMEKKNAAVERATAPDRQLEKKAVPQGSTQRNASPSRSQAVTPKNSNLDRIRELAAEKFGWGAAGKRTPAVSTTKTAPAKTAAPGSTNRAIQQPARVSQPNNNGILKGTSGTQRYEMLKPQTARAADVQRQRQESFTAARDRLMQMRETQPARQDVSDPGSFSQPAMKRVERSRVQAMPAAPRASVVQSRPTPIRQQLPQAVTRPAPETRLGMERPQAVQRMERAPQHNPAPSRQFTVRENRQSIREAPAASSRQTENFSRPNVQRNQAVRNYMNNRSGGRGRGR